MTSPDPTFFSPDKSGYRQILMTLPGMLADAKDNFLQQVAQLKAYANQVPDHLVICGMGGSAIAGDFVKHLMQEHSSCHIQVVRDYALPKHVGPNSIVILSSYSGHTEETLSAYESAMERQSRVICLSTGGKLADLTSKNGQSLIRLKPGMQPRQALPFGLVSLMGLCEMILAGKIDWRPLDEAIGIAGDLTVAYAPDGLKSLIETARGLAAKPVVVLSGENMLPAAVRLKGQLTENSKMLAFASPLPEMNHNEIVGWSGMASACNAILIRDGADHPRVAARLDILTKILSQKTTVVTVTTQGSSLLARFISLICWSDWLSYYAALVRQVDPTPVDIISNLKEELSRIPQK